MSHLEFTVLAAMMLSAALALIGNRTPRERAYAGTYFFLCSVVATVGGSWLMQLIHG